MTTLFAIGSGEIVGGDTEAIEISDDRWRVHAGSSTAFAFHLSTGDAGVSVDVLPSDGEFRPVSELL